MMKMFQIQRILLLVPLLLVPLLLLRHRPDEHKNLETRGQRTTNPRAGPPGCAKRYYYITTLTCARRVGVTLRAVHDL